MILGWFLPETLPFQHSLEGLHLFYFSESMKVYSVLIVLMVLMAITDIAQARDAATRGDALGEYIYSYL